jgi:hypothetical protein
MEIARVLSSVTFQAETSFGKKGIPVVAIRALLGRRRIKHLAQHAGKPLFQPALCTETLGKEEVAVWSLSADIVLPITGIPSTNGVVST